MLCKWHEYFTTDRHAEIPRYVGEIAQLLNTWHLTWVSSRLLEAKPSVRLGGNVSSVDELFLHFNVTLWTVWGITGKFQLPPNNNRKPENRASWVFGSWLFFRKHTWKRYATRNIVYPSRFSLEHFERMQARSIFAANNYINLPSGAPTFIFIFYFFNILLAFSWPHLHKSFFLLTGSITDCDWSISSKPNRLRFQFRF